jgi:hypothetical protein
MTKNAFVIMPFSATPTCTEQEWTETYNFIFKPAFEESGYVCERARPMVGHVLHGIVEKLRDSRIVLADITDRNPNVFYELGIRHSLKKGTIIVSRDGQVPSDLRGLWYVQYESTPAAVATFKAEIKRLTSEIEMNPDSSDNPVMDYLDREGLSISGFVNHENVKRLSALFTELTGDLVVLKGFLKHEAKVDFLSYGCLDLLCNTMYVDVGPEILASAYELRNRFKRLEAGERFDIPEIVKNTSQLLSKIDEIRDRLIRGEYAEPTSVSVMMWSERTDGLPFASANYACSFAFPRNQDWSRRLSGHQTAEPEDETTKKSPAVPTKGSRKR